MTLYRVRNTPFGQLDNFFSICSSISSGISPDVSSNQVQIPLVNSLKKNINNPEKSWILKLCTYPVNNFNTTILVIVSVVEVYVYWLKYELRGSVWALSMAIVYSTSHC